MLMTSEEAQTKWCPFSHAIPGPIEAPGTTGRRMAANPDATCLAEACACWRWWADPKGEQPGDYAPVGFCGMAGKP